MMRVFKGGEIMYKTQFGQQEDDKDFLLTKQNLKPIVMIYALILAGCVVAGWLLSGFFTIGLLGRVSFLLHIIAVVLFWVKYNKFGSPFIFWLAVWASALAFYDWHPIGFKGIFVNNFIYIAILAGAVLFAMQKKRKIKEGFRAQKKIFNYWGVAVLFYATSMLLSFGFWKAVFLWYLYTASIAVASVFILLSAIAVQNENNGAG